MGTALFQLNTQYMRKKFIKYNLPKRELVEKVLNICCLSNEVKLEKVTTNTILASTHD